MSKGKRRGADRKKSRNIRKLAVVAILVVVAGFVSFLSYGITYRSVVNFSFAYGTSDSARQTYQLLATSKFEPPTIDIAEVRISNNGSTGISVVVTLDALNAVVSTGYYVFPYTNAASIQVYLPPQSGNQFVPFYLALPSQVSSFTLRISVGQSWDFANLPALSTSSLALIQPIAPTTLVYSQETASPIVYQLTEQY